MKPIQSEIKQLTPEQANAFVNCLKSIENVPFPVAMSILTNILCEACRAEDVPLEYVLGAVTTTYQRLDELAAEERELSNAH